MRTLALETTGVGGGVAALVGERVVATRVLAAGTRSAKGLAPAIGEVCREVGWRAIEVELIAVTTGPGSFTGLRVGVTTAKALAYASGAGVVAVSALEVVAAQAPDHVVSTWVAFDAQREELFVARVARTDLSDPLSVVVEEPGGIVKASEWLAARKGWEVLTGPGLARYRDKFPPGAIVVDEAQWQPDAAMVGQIGWRRWQAGVRDDLWSLSPQYIRVSAAEEKAAKA